VILGEAVPGDPEGAQELVAENLSGMNGLTADQFADDLAGEGQGLAARGAGAQSGVVEHPQRELIPGRELGHPVGGEAGRRAGMA